MQEGYFLAAGTDSRRLINQLDPFFFQFRQGLFDVFNRKGDMLKSLAFLFDKFCNRSIRGCGFQQFHFTFSNREKCSGHLLLSNSGPALSRLEGLEEFAMTKFSSLMRAAKFALVPLALAGLSACASNFRADVSRFESQLPAPQGQRGHPART